MRIRKSKSLPVKAAVAVAAVLATLVVNPAPAQAAAACTVWAPMRGANGATIGTGMTVRGRIPAGKKFVYHLVFNDRWPMDRRSTQLVQWAAPRWSQVRHVVRIDAYVTTVPATLCRSWRR